MEDHPGVDEPLTDPSGTEQTAPDTRAGEPGRISKVLRDWLFVLAVALGAAFAVRLWVLQQFYISGPSMETTLFTDDRVLVNKLTYRFRDVHRGDVVVFDRVTRNGNEVAHDDLIKRVVALAGESIEIRGCTVFIDGRELAEPYLPDRDTSRGTPQERCRVENMRRTLVPARHVFVMGDNRPESFDSRSFGSIPESLIVGRAFAVVWPLGSAGGL